ncbi:MAG: DUF2461 domain-containing protein [Cyclobacteriaceae bacterium]
MIQTIKFLQSIKANNDRDWFHANKKQYEASYQEVLDLIDHVKTLLCEHDVLVDRSARKSVFRIYRDVRFSKDKSPYKTYWGGSFKRAGDDRRGGYYLHIEPNNTFLAGGFFAPNAQDLLHIRKQLELDADPLRQVIESQHFIQHFGELKGDQVKTTPRGFPKDHPDLDLIKHKSFIVNKSFDNKDVQNASFPDKINKEYQAMRTFFDVMTDYLTTDLNGNSLI